ncbi:ROK family protein [Alkalispirochaeta americana]|uniref:ROK family protein n=1 Tax=Alkalispirochaeta americana TaxID=159291 RepID=A0A1N6PWV6_9SPIO|nr:ROK family protein [Alkalispirochaeta americana]SIQ08772.1 ROK family protein [Alkalispirochaeta americana]
MNTERPHGASTLIVKDLNAQSVLRCLKEAQTATVRQLAGASGLSVVTVKAIMTSLVDQGKAFIGGKAPSGGGRPSQRYIFNEKHSLGLVIFTREVDGKDTVFLRVVDLYGQTLDSESIEIPSLGPDELETLIGEKILQFNRLQAISLGLPGIEYKGTIVSVDYKALIGIPLADRLRSRFGMPVLVENDVNAAVLGRDCEAYIYFPRKYPPGAGLLIQGTLLKGCHHFAGEIGWLPLGISWGPETADSFEDCCSAAAKVVASLTAVVDPASVVLYGEHLGKEHLQRIGELCRNLLPAQALPTLHCSEDFTADFEQGLKKILLNLLDENLLEKPLREEQIPKKKI